MRTNLTKTEQSGIACNRMNAIDRKYAHMEQSFRDFYIVKTLEAQLPTRPWEYPWAEVVRWLRARRRA